MDSLWHIEMASITPLMLWDSYKWVGCAEPRKDSHSGQEDVRWCEIPITLLRMRCNSKLICYFFWTFPFNTLSEQLRAN